MSTTVDAMILYCKKTLTEWNRVINYTWVWPVWRHLLRRDPGGAGQAARPVQAQKAKDGTFGRGVWPRSPPHHLAAPLSEPLASCTASSRQLCRVAAAASSWGCLSNGFAENSLQCQAPVSDRFNGYSTHTTIQLLQYDILCALFSNKWPPK